MGDMSRAGGCRKTIPDLDNDRAISDAEAAVTDQRCHAYPGDEFRFELWSAGGDGLFSALRGDDSSSNINYDNVQAGK
ncbi:MAG: hypothetical protein HRU15_19175 [Planctomycetes bacterium]|nr:hypothetical protein [Planctomycetota bacterium]